MAYDSTTKCINFLNDSVPGASGAQQITTGSSWSAREALTFEAPDCATFNCGLNEMHGNQPVANLTNAISAFVTATRASGDPLIIFPHPTDPTYNNGLTASYHSAVKSQCSTLGVAFLSLYEYYGSAYDATFAPRLRDGIHPMAPLYAEIAGIEKQALLAMAA